MNHLLAKTFATIALSGALVGATLGPALAAPSAPYTSGKRPPVTAVVTREPTSSVMASSAGSLINEVCVPRSGLPVGSTIASRSVTSYAAKAAPRPDPRNAAAAAA